MAKTSLQFNHLNNQSTMANREGDPNLGYLTRKETEVKLPRPTRVKIKTPAPVQITAETYLPRSPSVKRRIPPPNTKITDPTELADYRLRKRKEFEDSIRRVRSNKSVWVKYAKWEESQKDFNRARKRARQIFERWMSWEPHQQAWLSYIKFELRYNEIERARGIYQRFVQCLPKVGAWIRFAKFEMKNGEIARARNCYERAVDKLADDEEAETLFVAFAEFEEKCKETERARCIYKFALDHIPKGRAEDLYRKFVAFEKQYGDREGIEDAIVGKRRFQYEEEVRKNPLNYDSWFDHIRLEESVGNKQRIREVYERAIANVPPADEIRYWQRYIYLWINYALFEELDAQDVPRTRDVYSECLKLIPHKKSSGQLGNMDRCRKLYGKYLEWSPENCYAWSKYAELERSLMETERARAIFELANCRTPH
ncbi:crooked neck-like protein 1 [Tanacetum coccineum]